MPRDHAVDVPAEQYNRELLPQTVHRYRTHALGELARRRPAATLVAPGRRGEREYQSPVLTALAGSGWIRLAATNVGVRPGGWRSTWARRRSIPFDPTVGRARRPHAAPKGHRCRSGGEAGRSASTTRTSASAPSLRWRHDEAGRIILDPWSAFKPHHPAGIPDERKFPWEFVV